jgi:hypothetical protein
MDFELPLFFYHQGRRLATVVLELRRPVSNLSKVLEALALMRVCLYCLGEILRTPGGPMQGLIGCRCGALYHTDCAKTVVYCIECGSKLVELVEYPSPDETVTAD